MPGDYPPANFFVSAPTVTSQTVATVDGPVPHTNVARPFLVGGWAIDQGAAQSTGVDAVHIWRAMSRPRR